MKIKVISVNGHSNGFNGVPFSLVMFQEWGEKTNMMAIVFPDKGCIAILNTGMLSDGVYNYPNRWDGTVYEAALRKVLDDIEENGYSPNINKWIKME